MARNGNQGSAQQPTPQPRRQPQMAPDVRADFENAALKIATEFEYNLNDLKSTYEAKPESLKQAFDTMSQAKSDRQSWIGWTVGWTVAGALTVGVKRSVCSEAVDNKNNYYRHIITRVIKGRDN